MELKPLAIESLHNLESGQFLGRFFLDFTGAGLYPASDAEFQIIYNDLKSQLITFELALGQIVAQEESDLLFKLDIKRDRLVTSLRYAWKAYQFEEEGSNKHTAFNKLKKVMVAYKNIASENYEAESLGLDNFIQTLKNQEYIAFVRLLNMEEHLHNLENANQRFKKTFDNRSFAKINTVSYPTKELRKTIFNTYKEMCRYVLTMANLRTPNPFFIAVLEVLNNGRSSFATILAHRNTSVPNEKS